MSENTVLYSGDASNRAFPGIPGHWSQAMRERAEADLDLIARADAGFAEHISEVDPCADVEDFWEPVARTAGCLRAAQELGMTVELCPPATTLWTPERMARRVGSVWTHEEDRHASDPLLLHPTLRQHGGRWMAVAGYTDEPGELPADQDVVELALTRARKGIERLVVKFAASKTGLTVIDLHPEMSREDVHDALMSSSDGWELIRLAGRRRTLLVQDWIPMAYEYRLFVVDGRIITAAGCVEEHTPYSRPDVDTRFDARLRERRGNQITAELDTPVVERPDLVTRFLLAGVPIAARFDGTVSIDLALDAERDEIVVVELNTLPNAGLYATDADAVHRALLGATDRGYDHYAWGSTP